MGAVDNDDVTNGTTSVGGQSFDSGLQLRRTTSTCCAIRTPES